MHSPAFYSGDFVGDSWPGDIKDFGDLTGSGNPVLGTRGGYFTFGFTALYVLGKAMDDKIDVFFSQNEGGFGGQDTIQALSDGRTTYIMGGPAYQSPEDQNNGIFQKGSLLVLHGNEKIPVRLNPKFAAVERKKVEEAVGHVYAYPNPFVENTVLTFDNCTGTKMSVDICSSTGAIVKHEETPAVDRLQQYAPDLTSLAPGMYIIRMTCEGPNGWTGTANIIKTGAAIAPWKMDLKKMVGR